MRPSAVARRALPSVARARPNRYAPPGPMASQGDSGTGNGPSKQQRRQLGKDQRAAEQARATRRQTMIRIGYVALGLLVLAVAVWWVALRPRPGEHVPSQGRTHHPLDYAFDYSSDPPTSGPHFFTPAQAGIYRQPVHDQLLIHSMEHGHVVVHFNCDQPSTGSAPEDGDCSALGRSLADIATDMRVWKLIVVPRANLGSRLALTAWTRIDKFDNFDESRIRAFISAWRNRGPEATEM